jgi:RIP metalloprotease RseP
VLSWLAPIIVFGLVVFVHELGHFIAAKLTGVYAPRFSIGFGPSLLKKRFGETEYVVAALPLGGWRRGKMKRRRSSRVGVRIPLRRPAVRRTDSIPRP